MDLALRAIARLEGLVPDDEALDLEIERLAASVDSDVERVRKQLTKNLTALKRLGADDEETLLALNDLGTWTLESGDARGAHHGERAR